MSYKAFQDFYIEEDIKHLVLHEHNGLLVSPPFCTEKCKKYSSVMVMNVEENRKWFVDLDIPEATSKFNSVVSLNDSIWFIPYGIWDDFDVVVQLKNFKPIYHKIKKTGKGQFYSVATNGQTAFSFPLGYQDTSFCIYIKDDTVHTIDFQKEFHSKLHMGTVYCNGSYWSAPRGDTENYINLVKFDGKQILFFPLDLKNKKNTRKYSDLIVVENILYALPYGENSGTTEILEFDTITETYKLYDLDIPDFAKKFNTGVLVDDVIVAVPYGDEHQQNSNWGLIFNIKTKEYKIFDIGLTFGGKYRFRSGVNVNGKAVFLPTGSPACPILVIDKDGNVSKIDWNSNYILGRPIIYNNQIVTMCYDSLNQENYLLKIDL